MTPWRVAEVSHFRSSDPQDRRIRDNDSVLAVVPLGIRATDRKQLIRRVRTRFEVRAPTHNIRPSLWITRLQPVPFLKARDPHNASRFLASTPSGSSVFLNGAACGCQIGSHLQMRSQWGSLWRVIRNQFGGNCRQTYRHDSEASKPDRSPQVVVCPP